MSWCGLGCGKVVTLREMDQKNKVIEDDGSYVSHCHRRKLGGGGTENRMNSIMIGWSQRYWCELIFFYRGRYK